MIARHKTATTLLALFLAAALPAVACAAAAAPAGTEASAAAPQKKKKKSSDENNPQYQYEMGAIALRYGLTDEAVRYGQLAVSLDPEHLDGWKLLGLAYYTKGEFVLRRGRLRKGGRDQARRRRDPEEPRTGPGRDRRGGAGGRGAEEGLRRGRQRRNRLLPGQALLRRRALRRSPGVRPAIHPEGREEPQGLQPQGGRPQSAGPARRGRGKLPGRARPRPRGHRAPGQSGHRLHQRQRAGQGQDRPRSGPAQDHGRGPEEADRGVPRDHQRRSEVGRKKRASRARRKDTPFSTKARPSGQRSWKMPRSKAKSPSPVL